MHIGQGSQVVATIAPSRKILPTARQASRMAFTSAWAVMSVVSTTVLWEQESSLPSRAIAQPKGLWPAARPCRHFSIAKCISSAGSIDLSLDSSHRLGRLGEKRNPCPAFTLSCRRAVGKIALVGGEYRQGDSARAAAGAEINSAVKMELSSSGDVQSNGASASEGARGPVDAC